MLTNKLLVGVGAIDIACVKVSDSQLLSSGLHMNVIMDQCKCSQRSERTLACSISTCKEVEHTCEQRRCSRVPIQKIYLHSCRPNSFPYIPVLERLTTCRGCPVGGLAP